MGFIFSPLCICALCLSIVILYPKCWGLNSGLLIPDSCSPEHWLSSQHCFLSVKIILGSEELAPAALTEDSSLVPTPTWLLTTTCNCSFGIWCPPLTRVQVFNVCDAHPTLNHPYRGQERVSDVLEVKLPVVLLGTELPPFARAVCILYWWTTSAASAVRLCYHLNHLSSLCHLTLLPFEPPLQPLSLDFVTMSSSPHCSVPHSFLFSSCFHFFPS